MAMNGKSNIRLKKWHDYLESGDAADLSAQLADDVVFLSPVVHSPQQGKAITMAYLSAAAQVLGNDDFRYLQIFDCGDRAVLEFETVIDGIIINGIDMIKWNDDGQITEFKVMVRPLKAIQAIHAAMGKKLMEMQGG